MSPQVTRIKAIFLIYEFHVMDLSEKHGDFQFVKFFLLFFTMYIKKNQHTNYVNLSCDSHFWEQIK